MTKKDYNFQDTTSHKFHSDSLFRMVQYIRLEVFQDEQKSKFPSTIVTYGKHWIDLVQRGPR